MTKILFLADLHGNMTATLALEKEMEKIKPDDVWFLGDCVGKGPENDKTLDWVRENCGHHIAGNWDEDIVKGAKKDPEFKDPFAFFWKQLGKERLEWLASLPFEDEILISGISFRLFHGRHLDKNYHPYLSMDEMVPGFTDTKGKVHGGFICGDCHMPYVREMKQGYALNTGSVGNSLGVTNCHALLIEGEPGSSDLAPISMNILSIPYDNELAAKVADEYPLPYKEAYKNEVMTGVYSR